MAKKLRREFSHAFSGQIWRMDPELTTGHIALEVRSPDQHTVRYALLHTDTPGLAWEDMDAGTGWYGGLLALHGDFLVIHGYSERPDPSADDTLIVASAISGDILWEIEHVRFLSFSGTETMTVFSTVEDGNPQLSVHLVSGEMEYLDPDNGAEIIPADPNNTKALQLPLHYPEENTHFGSLARLIAELTGHQAIKEIEYAEWGDCVVISYYLYSRDLLDNFLLIIDKEGNTLYHGVLSQGLQGLASDSFFLLDRKLFFIKNKNILCVYDQ